MKNLNGVLVLGILLLVGLVSADSGCSIVNGQSVNSGDCVGMTLISGTIYSPDPYVGISGASVEVECNGNVKNTFSFFGGMYAVYFNQNECEAGNTVNVYASHPDYGANSRSGVVSEMFPLVLDVATVNVPLVPEFGVVLGMLTMLSAVGIFFVVRKD